MEFFLRLSIRSVDMGGRSVGAGSRSIWGVGLTHTF